MSHAKRRSAKARGTLWVPALFTRPSVGIAVAEGQVVGKGKSVLFRVLGPLVVEDQGRTIDLTSATQRALLSWLLLYAGRPQPPDVLIDRLWGEKPPTGGRRVLRFHVSKLRESLRQYQPSAPRDHVITTDAHGYLVRLDGHQLDAYLFEDLAERGRREADGDPQLALSTFESGLAMWRGRAYEEVADESFAQPEVARLHEARKAVHTDLAELRLRLGQERTTLGELESLRAEFPYDERIRGLLMLALYRSGRQTEALRVYSATRELLGEELGIEPSPELARLEEQILLQDEGGLAQEINKPLVPASELRLDEIAGAVLLMDLTLSRTGIGSVASAKDASGRADLIIRSVVSAHQGESYPVAGGGWVTVFANVDEAIRAVEELREGWARVQSQLPGELLLRFSLDYQPRGRTPQRRTALEKCQQLLQEAHPGQVLVTADAAAQIRNPDTEERLRDLGGFRFADGGSIRVSDFRDAAFPVDFPPLQTTIANVDLSAFLPADRRQQLASGQPEGWEAFGTAMLIALRSEGDNGLGGDPFGPTSEFDALDSVLRSTATTVHRLAGAVVSATDSGVLCWFESDHGGRAVEAATTIIDRLSITPDEGPAMAGPSVSISICAGNARRFAVGGAAASLLEVIAGDVITRAEEASALAATGEVIVGAEILARAPGADVVRWSRAPTEERFAVVLQGQRSAESVEIPILPTVGVRVARDWLPSTVFRSIALGHGAFMGRRHTAAVLVAEAKIDLLEPDVDARFAEDISEISAVVSEMKGQVVRVRATPSGFTVEAVLGVDVPVEDLSSLAASAAVVALDRLAALDREWTLRLGVSMGEVQAGIAGGPRRRVFAIVGTPFARARGLLKLAAANQVIVDQTIAQTARGGGSFDEVRGRTNQQGWVVGPADVTEEIPPVPGAELIERDADVGQALQALDKVSSKVSRMVIVSGESGIGKTALLRSVVAEAEDRGVPVLTGTGQQVFIGADVSGNRAAYHAWTHIVEELLHKPTEDAAAWHAIPSPDDRRAPLLSTLVEWPEAPNEFTSGLSPEARAGNLRSLIVDLLTESRRRSGVGVIVIDDAHWMDSGSWELALDVVSTVPGVLLLLATRPIEGSSLREAAARTVFRDATKRATTTVIKLQGLSHAGTAELVQRRVGQPVSDGAVEALWRSAGGNPLFLEALIDETGGADHDSAYEPERDAPRAIPQRVRGAIAARLGRLPDRQLMAAKVASVLGERFTIDDLRAVYPVATDIPYLQESLSGLVERGILIRLDTGKGYEYHHTIIRDVAYASIDVAIAAELHRAAAAHFERSAGVSAANLSEIANHLQLGGLPEAAANYWEQVGDIALHSYANAEAESVFRRLSDMSDAAPEREATWRTKRGVALANLACYELAMGQLVAGLALLDERVPSRSPWAIVRALTAIASRSLHRHRDLPGRSGDVSWVRGDAAIAHEKLVEVYFFNDLPMHALYAAATALKVAEREGLAGDYARACATYGAIMGFIPLRRRADRWFARSRNALSGTDDTFSLMYVDLVEGFYRIGVGQWTESANLMRHLHETAAEMGDRRRVEDAVGNQAAIELLAGDIERGVSLSDELRSIAASRRALHSLAFAYEGLALGLTRTGDVAGADDAASHLHYLLNGVSDLGQCPSVCKDRGRASEDATCPPELVLDEALWAELHGILAFLRLEVGDTEGALASARFVMTLIGRTPPSNYSAITAYMAPAEVLLWAKHSGAPVGRSEIRQALRVAARYARVFPIGRPRHHLARGRRKAMSGRNRRARALVERGIRAAEELDMPYDRSVSYCVAANFLNNTPEEATRLREAGERGLEEIGAQIPRWAQRPIDTALM